MDSEPMTEQHQKEIKEEHDNIDQKIKEEHDNIDQKIKEEHENMDNNLDLPLPKLMTEQHQREIIPPAPAEDEPDLVMEFRVHAEGEFIDKSYQGGRTGYSRIVKPAKLEWDVILKGLRYQGYLETSDLYFLDPAREIPDGLVKMLGPAQVWELMEAHKGVKTCDLYIVGAASLSDISSGEQDDVEYDGLMPTEQLGGDIDSELEVDTASETSKHFKRTRESDEAAGSSQPKKQHAVDDHSTITCSSDDE